MNEELERTGKNEAIEVQEEAMTLSCRQCGRDFLFTVAEQEFYREKGFNTPRRCKECRTNGKVQIEPEPQRQPQHLNCARCGTELGEESSVYCPTCIENTRLEVEITTKKMQDELKETCARLKEIESENTELNNELEREKTLVSELEANISVISKKLENANKLHASLSEWFKPVLADVEAKLDKRLESLELGQTRINERMLQLAEKIHEMREKTTLMDIIKQSFRTKQNKQPV
jgi:hypothetical protein